MAGIDIDRSARTARLLPEQDLLTGCLTRIGAIERVPHGPVGVAYVDADHFRLVNRVFGNQTGDAVLCAFARRVAVAARGVAEDALVIRMVAEFIVVIGSADADLVRRVGDEIIVRLDRPIALPVPVNVLIPGMTAIGPRNGAATVTPDPDGRFFGRAVAVQVRASVGVATGSGHWWEEVAHAADLRCSEAKAAGRSCRRG